jgi:cellulose synthase/poly-beta-1,6-N-acetylglucosamine synthase-like glycosyltransferase
MGSSIISVPNGIIALNVIAVVALSAYAFHQGILLLFFLRYKVGERWMQHRQVRGGAGVSRKSSSGAEDNAPPCVKPGAPVPLPSVTIQLPLYNERYVAERVIGAACALDYPRELLQVQVLDDSTDDTSRIVQRAVRTGRAHGVNVEVIHRENRAGYKAGALAHGLHSAHGELIAIFDADFVPPRNFLKRILCEKRAFDDPRVGFVQARWGHLNRETNAVTRAQAVMLDMHFVIDQFVRSRMGLLMNFNGSCGVWRRAAIDDAGGWQSDTLTEDLDLSYRAELKGWRGRYLDDLVCPGELPVSVLAFKRQQARWARGSAQCVRKLAPLIIHSDRPLLHKLAALMHISGYFANLFVLLLAIITPLLMLDTSALRLLPEWLSMMSVIGLSPILAMFVAQGVQRRGLQFLANLPITIVLGIGVSLSNSIAVLVGLFGKSSGEFVRTPKSAAQGRSPVAPTLFNSSNLSNTSGTPAMPAPSRPVRRAAGTPGQATRHTYLLQPDWTLRAEMALGLYALSICTLLVLHGAWLSIVPTLLYMCSFLSVVLGQLMPVPSLPAHGSGHERKVESRLPSMK